MTGSNHWLAKLGKIRVDRARGDPAPHKPLLLLALLTQVDEEKQVPDLLPLTPELAFRFQTLGVVVAHRRSQRPDVRLPFHHLASDGFWSAMDRAGQPSSDYKTTIVAAVDPDFREFVGDEHNRLNAKRVLINEYFQPIERAVLRELVGIPAEELGPTDVNGAPIDFREAEKQGREARFRLLVVAAYNCTCALSGYRLTTVTGTSIVDAAHIHRFADSRNNDVRNGLALSKSAHWSFDQGLWSLTNDYRVIVAHRKFHEAGPSVLSLAQYDGREICLPRDDGFRPDPEHIAWHRTHVFDRD